MLSASGSWRFASAGGVPTLTKLLHSTRPEAVAPAARVAAYLLRDSPPRSLVDALTPALLHALSKGSTPASLDVLYALSNLFGVCPAALIGESAATLGKGLVRVLQDPEQEEALHFAMALMSLLLLQPHLRKALIDAGVEQPLRALVAGGWRGPELLIGMLTAQPASHTDGHLDARPLAHTPPPEHAPPTYEPPPPQPSSPPQSSTPRTTTRVASDSPSVASSMSSAPPPYAPIQIPSPYVPVANGGEHHPASAYHPPPPTQPPVPPFVEAPIVVPATALPPAPVHSPTHRPPPPPPTLMQSVPQRVPAPAPPPAAPPLGPPPLVLQSSDGRSATAEHAAYFAAPALRPHVPEVPPLIDMNSGCLNEKPSLL